VLVAATIPVGIMPTSKLHIYDETMNNTKLTIQNNYLFTNVISSPLPRSTINIGNGTWQFQLQGIMHLKCC
jgi:hypothetical protein